MVKCTYKVEKIDIFSSQRRILDFFFLQISDPRWTRLTLAHIPNRVAPFRATNLDLKHPWQQTDRRASIRQEIMWKLQISLSNRKPASFLLCHILILMHFVFISSEDTAVLAVCKSFFFLYIYTGKKWNHHILCEYFKEPFIFLIHNILTMACLMCNIGPLTLWWIF